MGKWVEREASFETDVKRFAKFRVVQQAASALPFHLRSGPGLHEGRSL